MPLTHDMGLIGYHLSVLGAGMNHAIMDTNVFVRRPLLWMAKANELRATQLCSPNFGYKHFLKLFQRKGMPDLDLSCVKLILNGAEPISWDLCEEFLNALESHGLSRTAMFPVYGLAEATVGVSIPAPGSEYSRITVDRHSLRVGDSSVPVPLDDANAVSFVRVGNAVRDVSIRITDDVEAIFSFWAEALPSVSTVMKVRQPIFSPPMAGCVLAIVDCSSRINWSSRVGRKTSLS
jgi:acyl-CoA synthetase (AMP-forming)/AMP-acid ligase II